MSWTAIVADEKATAFDEREQIIHSEIGPITVRALCVQAYVEQDLAFVWCCGKDHWEPIALLEPVGKFSEASFFPLFRWQRRCWMDQQIPRRPNSCRIQPFLHARAGVILQV